jgi:predicted transcriptional regulator
MKHAGLEDRLLSSIAQRGIQEPLEGAELDSSCILLNGFKRLRCAQKLHIHSVPFLPLGTDELSAIVQLLRAAQTKSLSLLEQARFVDELKNTRGLSVAEIAEHLSRSKAWVSLRLGLLAQMTPLVREQLFAGAFPVYSYMYTVREFMRLKGAALTDSFVQALSGKKLSVRQIEQLAHAFFRGPESFRAEILQGNVALALKQLDQAPKDPDACSEFERILLHDLETLQKYQQRVLGKCADPRLKSRAFFAQAHLLTAGLLSRSTAVHQTLTQFHDRCGHA